MKLRCSLLFISTLWTTQSGVVVFAEATRPREAGDLIGQGAWRASGRKGEEAPASPTVVSPGLAGSRQAAFFRMSGYNAAGNTGAEREFSAISGKHLTIELVVKPSSRNRCLAVTIRSDGEAAAYIRFNGKKQGWCQHYDKASQYRDIAAYEVNAENVLKIQLDTTRHKLKAWVNGVGGAEWDFRAPVSSVNRLDLFMTHGNGPEVWSLVDNVIVRDDEGKMILKEDFEDFKGGPAGSRPASLPASPAQAGLQSQPGP